MTMKKILIFIISIYQKTLSFDHGLPHKYLGTATCRFYPTCSEYTKEAIQKHGVSKGIFLGAKRLSRCHPWNKGGHDPVPKE